MGLKGISLDTPYYVFRLLYLFFLGLLYVWNTHYHEKILHRIHQLQPIVDGLRVKHMQLQSSYMFDSKQSEVAKKVAPLAIYESKTPLTPLKPIKKVTHTKAILLRARIVFLFVVFFVGVVIWKIVHLQFLEVDKWRHRAKVAQLEYRPILATRGNIYADDGALLATSLPFYRVALDPVLASDLCFKTGIDPLSQALSDFYKTHPPDYYKKLIIDARARKRRYLLLDQGYITYEEKKMMSRWPIFSQGRFKEG